MPESIQANPDGYVNTTSDGYVIVAEDGADCCCGEGGGELCCIVRPLQVCAEATGPDCNCGQRYRSTFRLHVIVTSRTFPGTEWPTDSLREATIAGEIVYVCQAEGAPEAIESARLTEYAVVTLARSSLNVEASTLDLLDDIPEADRPGLASLFATLCGEGTLTASRMVWAAADRAGTRLQNRVNDIINGSNDPTGSWFVPVINDGTILGVNQAHLPTGAPLPCPRTHQHAGEPGFPWPLIFANFPGANYDPAIVWQGNADCRNVSYSAANTYLMSIGNDQGGLTGIGEVGASAEYTRTLTVLDPCPTDPCAEPGTGCAGCGGPDS